MKKSELTMRLDILLDQHVINKQAYDVTVTAFESLLNAIGKEDIEQAEMLFTHLPTALTRTNIGEEVERPSSEIISEIQKSDHFSLAEAQVGELERLWGKKLPIGEKEYLYMHYCNVIQINKGGIES